MRVFAVLIPETDALWMYLKDRPELGGFVLIGGSALALRIGHRFSEDLDFTWTAPRLPGSALDLLIRQARLSGFEFLQQDDPAALDEFEIAGMELRDYQRDYLVNGTVKVTFFTADSGLAKILGNEPSAGACRVATLEELFDSKALISASRSKTRDWLDLYLLMRDHGFSVDDYASAFSKAGTPSLCSLGFSRLCGGKPQKNDEGYEGLIDPAPSIEEMTSYFRAQRDAWEVSEATKRASRISNGKA